MQPEPYIYQKIREIFNKHCQNGTPRKLIESNMAREFRLGKIEMKKVMEEMHLENEMVQRRHLKKIQIAQPEVRRDNYLADLRASQ